MRITPPNIFTKKNHCTEYLYEECRVVRWRDWIATAPDGTALYGELERFEAPNGRPIEAVEMICYDYEKNITYPCYDLYYVDVYFSSEELEEIRKQKTPKTDSEMAEIMRTKEAEEYEAELVSELNAWKNNMKVLAVRLYDMMKENQNKLKSIKVDTRPQKDDDEDVSLNFYGDNDVYHIYGITQSIAFLLQRIIVAFAPKPEKKVKLSVLREKLDELNMRVRRFQHEIPMSESKIQVLEKQLLPLNAQIAKITDLIQNGELSSWDDDDKVVFLQAVDPKDYQKTLNSLLLSRIKLNDAIKMQQLKVKKLTFENDAMGREIEELEKDIECHMTGGKKSKPPQQDPRYVLANQALKVLNKRNKDSDSLLHYLHEYADSFCEKTDVDLFIEEIAESSLNFRAAKKPREHREPREVKPLVTPVVDAPVVSAPVVDAPVVSAPVVDAPVVSAPVVDAPVVSAPVVDAPVVSAPAAAASQKAPPKKSSRLDRIAAAKGKKST